MFHLYFLGNTYLLVSCIFSIKGDLVFEYQGDRTRDDIVNFAHRLIGPSINAIATKSDFEAAKSRSEIFFMFAGEPAGPEWVNELFVIYSYIDDNYR